MLLELMRGPKMAKVMEAFMKMREVRHRGLKRAARKGACASHQNRARRRNRALFKGELIAESRDALNEGRQLPTVYYFPRKDVKMDRLAPTSHKTHCPFKGDASYFSVVNGPENAVWSYEQPYDEMATIKDGLAFYPDKFEIKPS